MRAVVYDPATGMLVQGMIADEPQIADLCKGQGWAYLEAAPGVTGATHYVDAGALVAYPPRPNQAVVWSPLAKTWVDPRPLAMLKAESKAAMNAARESADAGGFTWNGSPFQSDETSRARIGLNVTLAAVSLLNKQAFSVTWTLADNSQQSFTATDWLAIGQALSAKLTANNQQAQARKASIEAATDAAGVATAAVW